MGILTWILVGAIAGWLASIIIGTNSRQGPGADIVVGILGALLGGFIMGLFNQPGVYGFNVYSIAVAAMGAVVLLAIVRLIRAYRTT